MPSRRRKITLAIVGTALVPLAVIGWFAYRIFFTLNIPQAYAAWDTGTLLVEYMKSHNDHWPTSWDDLLTTLNTDSGRDIPLRGAQAGDIPYAQSLREKISIDWTFDPNHPDRHNPVTRPDGSAFPVTWQNADPNEMVRKYLADRAATQPSPPT
jgi:hypothetical protein